MAWNPIKWAKGKVGRGALWTGGVLGGIALVTTIATRTNKTAPDAIREGNALAGRIPEANDIPQVMPAFGPADGRMPGEWQSRIGAQRGGQAVDMNPSLDPDLAANTQDAQAAAAAQAPAR